MSNGDPLTNPSNAGVTPSHDDSKTHTKPRTGIDWEYERWRAQGVENIWGREKTPKGKR